MLSLLPRLGCISTPLPVLSLAPPQNALLDLSGSISKKLVPSLSRLKTAGWVFYLRKHNVLAAYFYSSCDSSKYASVTAIARASETSEPSVRFAFPLSSLLTCGEEMPSRCAKSSWLTPFRWRQRRTFAPHICLSSSNRSICRNLGGRSASIYSLAYLYLCEIYKYLTNTITFMSAHKVVASFLTGCIRRTYAGVSVSGRV
jgi:hypothetical protein